ncbi:MAG: magnesium transporter [Methanobacteriota archaeon]
MAPSVSVRTIVVQGLTILIICALIEILAGNVMEGMKERLTVTLPGLILVLPPLLGLRGNVNGALASRLGTALNTGVIEPKLSMSTELKVNVSSSLILTLVASATIGVLSYLIGTLLGIEAINFVALVTIAVVAGVLSGIVLAGLTVIVSIFSYKRGWDPDNVTAPLMATIGDLITMVSVFMVAILV